MKISCRYLAFVLFDAMFLVSALEYTVVRDLGCWQDNGETPIIPQINVHDLISNYRPTNEKNLVQMCAAKTKQLGYNVFGVKDGMFCYTASNADATYSIHGTSKSCLRDGRGGKDSIQVYEIESVVDVQYQKLGCFLEEPNVKPIPDIEQVFLDLHDNVKTRVDSINKCARSTEALGFRFFAIRANGLCATSENANSIYKTYTTKCLQKVISSHQQTTVYELTAGIKATVVNMGCKNLNPLNPPEYVASLETTARILPPISTRRDPVSSCARYAIGFNTEAVALGSNGHCKMNNWGIDAFGYMNSSNECDKANGIGSLTSYQSYCVLRKKLNIMPQTASPETFHYLKPIGCLFGKVPDSLMTQLAVLQEPNSVDALKANLKMCAEMSSKHGHGGRVFGLMNGNICMAADDETVLPKLRFDQNCQSFPNTTQLFLRDLVQTAPTISGIGCYLDSKMLSLEGTDERLTGMSSRKSSAIMNCAKVSATRGYKVFVIQEGTCRSSVDAHLTYWTRGIAICNLNGEGSKGINQVYEIKESIKLKIRSLGCWKTDSFQTIAIAEGSHPDLNDNHRRRVDAVEKCAQYAYNSGYGIFGIQDGGLCVTSPEARMQYQRIGNSEVCGENGKGGLWSNQVYEIVE